MLLNFTKNRRNTFCLQKCKRLLFIFVAMLFVTSGYISAQSTQPKVTFDVKKANFSQIVEILRVQTNYQFIFNSDDVKGLTNITCEFRNADFENVLKKILTETNSGIGYEIEGTTVIIKRISDRNSQQKNVIEGVVVDQDKNPIVGASVYVKGTTTGAYTDENGKFKIVSGNIPHNSTIAFSCISYESKEYNVENIPAVVVLQESMNFIENAVVTGYFERDKSTFTGAAKTLEGDQLRAISTTNVINALSILEPSISIAPNNNQGSNPNAIPEIILRGTTSLNTSNQVGVNSPLIVIDGVESSLRALYDMNIFDIESVTVLKDASATALYGEQAANGVILVNRKMSSQKQVRISYNLTSKFDFPDISDYNMMNAAEKLEFERLSGLYVDLTGDKYLEYAEKLARVNSGIDTDWMSKPLRNAFSHNHSVNVSGEGSGLSYRVSMNYLKNNGVMKDDYRNNMGIGYFLSYNYKSKFIATLRTDYSQNSTNASKYGSFRNYVNANPYEAPYDESGELRANLNDGLVNPLFEASLSSFSKTKSKDLNASLNLRWNIMPGLFITGFGSLNSTDSRQDQYVSPLSNNFLYVLDPSKKGSYSISSGENTSYLVRSTVNYSKDLDGMGSVITLNLGGEVRESQSLPYTFSATGFFNDRLTDPTFASGYAEGSSPYGESSESATAALTSSFNATYKNRYFADGSYRLSGSSKFGTENRYAPFWSLGVGWNMHREEWLKNLEFFDILRLRASYGHTGSINFASYQAITTFRYASNLVNKFGLGASPITMGNPDLKWQTTQATNVGLSSSFLKGRFDVNFDWYNYRTVDMIVPISMPPSSGVSTVNNNVGEQTNKGFDVVLSGIVFRNDDWMVRVNATAAHNVNKLIKIGNALKSQNDINASISGTSPISMYIEGESTSMIYTVRSAGIDPATGREIFIGKNGEYTFTYNPADKMAVGDANPTLRGSLSSFVTYKGFSFNINMMYSAGGYIYNSTRAQRIEQINPMYNSDKRALTNRWKKPGDIVDYLTLVPNSSGTINNYHTSRFVEKENFLSISSITLGYEFDSRFLNKFKCKRLNVSLSMNDIVRFSTVKQERGIFYPFARGFSFTISPTF